MEYFTYYCYKKISRVYNTKCVTHEFTKSYRCERFRGGKIIGYGCTIELNSIYHHTKGPSFVFYDENGRKTESLYYIYDVLKAGELH